MPAISGRISNHVKPSELNTVKIRLDFVSNNNGDQTPEDHTTVEKNGEDSGATKAAAEQILQAAIAKKDKQFADL
jgi:hypothetical protein